GGGVPGGLAGGVGGDAEDHQLGVLARQLPSGHQAAGEPDPAPEQAPVAGEGGEDPRRPAFGGEAQQPRDPGVDEPDLLSGPGLDPRRLASRHRGEGTVRAVAAPFTKLNLAEVEDSAPRFGLGDVQQARFANSDLDVEQAGLAYHRLAPGRRQGFGHRHDRAEEIYVILSGAGRVKLDDEIVDVGALDAVRVGPGVTRQFEAGPGGLEYLALGALADRDDFELLDDWWQD